MQISGVRLSAAHCGIKRGGELDLALIELGSDAVTAAVFTQNSFCAAPVQIARRNLAANTPRALLINAGNANAGTGVSGLRAADECCQALASELGLEPRSVLPFSTGVIGEPLPVDRMQQKFSLLRDDLDGDNWQIAATAIMTTDTKPKVATAQVQIEGEIVTVTGIAKGAGMIKPNMATLLAFVATDATLTAGDLQLLLNDVNATSFNRITVDGDTSTNDSCTLTATCALDVTLTPAHDHWKSFAECVRGVFEELAIALIKDAEGASKFVTVQVSGGSTIAECDNVAYAVAESPLVKTALFASDANWGRILAAVGRAGVLGLDVSGVNIDLDEVRIVTRGERDAHYQEADGERVFSQDEFSIHIDLGRGIERTRIWTCDLSHDYVRINAEYRS